MADIELLIPLAEIAGVFVGFGALIAVRSAGAGDPLAVVCIRFVMTLGVWVVVAAIAPVIVSRYGVTDHELWLACSLLGLALYLGLWIVNERTTEAREVAAALPASQSVWTVALFWAFTVPVIATLVLVVLGPLPDQEPALYLTAVGFVLSLAAGTLLLLVLSQRRPRTAPDPAELPATGGSSA